MGWYDERFTEDLKRHHRECVVCSRSMWLPACKVHKYITCGGACAAKNYEQRRQATEALDHRKERAILGPYSYTCAQCGKPGVSSKPNRLCCGPTCLEAYRLDRATALLASRTRSCSHCGLSFIAKKSQIDSGHGRYCSQKCNYASEGASRLTEKEVQAYAVQMHKKAIADGRHTYKSGELHHAWKGGLEASLARGRHKSAASLRLYRRNNPHKIKEFSATASTAGWCAPSKGRRLDGLSVGLYMLCAKTRGVRRSASAASGSDSLAVNSGRTRRCSGCRVSRH